MYVAENPCLRKEFSVKINDDYFCLFFQDKLVEEIFSHEDKDKDGYISHEEFSGPKHDEL